LTAADLHISQSRDAAALAGIHAACFDDGWDAGAIATLLDLPGTAAFVAADSDGAPCAMIMLRRAGDDCEVLTIGVARDRRRAGLGARLVAAACAWAAAAGCGRVVLEVADDNAAGLALYRGAGFTPCGRRHAYYQRSGGQRRDALIFERKLARTHR
jgi:ribosomal-protein-alanine N-acetyltransferase